jgi:hypothetical protein
LLKSMFSSFKTRGIHRVEPSFAPTTALMNITTSLLAYHELSRHRGERSPTRCNVPRIETRSPLGRTRAQSWAAMRRGCNVCGAFARGGRHVLELDEGSYCIGRICPITHLRRYGKAYPTALLLSTRVDIAVAAHKDGGVFLSVAFVSPSTRAFLHRANKNLLTFALKSSANNKPSASMVFVSPHYVHMSWRIGWFLAIPSTHAKQFSWYANL